MLNQSELFEELDVDSVPFPDSSPLAKDEGFPWLPFSSLPFMRIFHNRNSKMNEPCSSGSDRPGILPARRPCFTTAKLSPGKPNKETPEAKTVLLFTNKEEQHFSLSMLILSFEAEAVTSVLRVPFWSVCEEGRIICMCWGFLLQSTLVVDKAVVAMSTKVYVLIVYFTIREKNRICSAQNTRVQKIIETDVWWKD